MQATTSLAKNWLTLRNINFYFSTALQLSAGRYKFGDINNNELLIINLVPIAMGAFQIFAFKISYMV